jgi:H+/gluconate symporter-like permease
VITIRALLLKNKKDSNKEENDKKYTQKNINTNNNNTNKYKEDDDTEKFTQRRTLWLIATIVLAIVGIVVFYFTENMKLPMRMVDNWTIVNAIILIVELIAVFLVFKQTKTENQEDKQKQTNHP